MNVTDEMIERMKDAVEGECDGLAIETHHARAILEYVFSASPAGVVKPKPLEWRDKSIGVYRRDRAKTSIGTYSAWRDGSLYYNEERIKICADFEAAKSAAFADYSARIMSAIEPGVGVETAKAEAFDKIVAARKKHIDAVAAYNARRELATAERMRGSWAIKLDDEYRAMHDAQSELFIVMQSVCDASLKGDEQ